MTHVTHTAPVPAIAGRLAALIGAWWARRRHRAQLRATMATLSHLSDNTLADIGLTRGDIATRVLDRLPRE